MDYNSDLAQAKEKVAIATKAYNNVMCKKSKKMKGGTKEAIQRTRAALEAANEGLHAAEVSAQKAKKRPSMGREPESVELGPKPKCLCHTDGEDSSMGSELTEGGGLQILVEVAPSYQQVMLKQGELFSLGMVAQTMGDDNGNVEAEQGGSKCDGRGDTEDLDSSSSSNEPNISNKDVVEMGKGDGGKKDGGDVPDKKNDHAEELAVKNGGVRKRNNTQDDFDILTQVERIKMEDFLRIGTKLPAVHRRLLREVPKLMPECLVISKELSLHILGTTKGNFQCIWHHFGCCGDPTETTILPKPMVPGARLVVNSQMEKVPTRVKGRKTFKKVLVEPADPEEGLLHCRCPIDDALFDFIIFKMQHVFDPTTTEFTSPKMTPSVRTLLRHMLRSVADLSLDDFYLRPEYFKDHIPSTTPFPRYFSYEYQLEIAQKAMKGLLAWIRFLNHVLSKGETQLEVEDIEIWQEELSKEKIAARMACKTARKEKQDEDSLDEDGMEEK
ncbi:hypothetical protein DXG01_011651 [Tephrocybe rancida]|nr:hypothetical protein DXG01_011651 [Tephrocybe rancida]